MKSIGSGSNELEDCLTRRRSRFVCPIRSAKKVNNSIIYKNKGEKMGHKGANKLKPKKSKSLPHENLNLSSIAHSGSNPVQSLVKNNGSGKGEIIPAAGSNKKNRKGK